MIEQVLAGDGDYDLHWNLIGAIRDGFPVENLRPLFTSDDPRITATAAYLAYELGSAMRPILSELIALADHPGAQWRSDIIIAMTDCVGPDDLDALSRIMLALDDPEPFVHRSAMNFVITARALSLVNAATEAARRYPTSPFGTIHSLLLSGRSRLDSSSLCVSTAKLSEFIGHEAPIVRRFGVGLSARPICVVDIERLEIARKCGDEEGRRIIEFNMWSPRSGGRLAKVEYLESGRDRGELGPTQRRRRRE